jgi:DNA-binding response OmpR family regulator
VPQLIDQFRKLHNGRVLVCSGYAPAETGLSSEMYDDFLVKPFASDDLVRRIHALMA